MRAASRLSRLPGSVPGALRNCNANPAQPGSNSTATTRRRPRASTVATFKARVVEPTPPLAPAKPSTIPFRPPGVSDWPAPGSWLRFRAVDGAHQRPAAELALQQIVLSALADGLQGEFLLFVAGQHDDWRPQRAATDDGQSV